MIVKLEESGVQLTKEQNEWLKTNETFSESMKED